MIITLCLFMISADVVLDSTEVHYVNLKSYYVEFVQTFCNNDEGTCERFIGKVAFKAPDKMRMEIEGAEDQINLYDGEWFWVYVPKEHKVYKKKVGGQLFDLRNLIKDYQTRFTYKLIKKKPPYEVEFLPTGDDEGMKRMVLVISKGFLIKGLTIIDPMGNESKFDFNRFTLNKNLSDKIFKLKLPKGVEVIEQ